MSITLADLIQSTREVAGVQNNQIVSNTGEMPRIVNLAVSSVYDTVVKAYQPYFAEKSDFTVDATGIASLASIVNPTQATQTYVNGMGLSIFDTDHNVTLAATFSPLALPVLYTVESFTIHPTSACNTGDTSFQLKVNGVATGDSVIVPSGSSSDEVNTVVNPTFTVNDTVTMDITCATPGSWACTITIVVRASLNKPPFYKELGVDYTSQGRALTLPRLDSFLARNQNNSAISDVSGNYTLWYIPSCPVLDDVYDLPTEMERFRDLILLEGAISIYLKRQMPTADLEMRLAKKVHDVEASLKNRVNEPRAIPLRGASGGCGRSFDIIGSTLQIFRSSGYSTDYFWSAR